MHTTAATPIAEPPSHHFLPQSALTLLLGDPGTGKSLLALDLAARLSRGESPLSTNDSTPGAPSCTLLISTEDSEQTLRSRAVAANAAPSFLLPLPSELSLVPPKNPLFPGPSRHPSTLLQALRFLLPKLEEKNKPARLLILDPLPAFLGNYDCSHAASIRRLLSPLLQLAQQQNFSILGITHLNKSPQSRTQNQNQNPLHRALNSIAYVALARSVLLLTKDDQTYQPNRRLLIPIKSNLTNPTHALAFTITNSPNPQSPPSATAGANLPTHSKELTTPLSQIENQKSKIENPLDQTAHIEWEETPITNHPLLTNQPAQPTDPILRSQLELAEDFLRTTLADGPLPSATLLKQSRTLGLSQRTLHRARATLHVSCYFDPASHNWLCSLPTQSIQN